MISLIQGSDDFPADTHPLPSVASSNNAGGRVDLSLTGGTQRARAPPVESVMQKPNEASGPPRAAGPVKRRYMPVHGRGSAEGQILTGARGGAGSGPDTHRGSRPADNPPGPLTGVRCSRGAGRTVQVTPAAVIGKRSADAVKARVTSVCSRA